ncbi:MAG: (d)CMP kinase [Actinomycetes bacterium]
MVAIDGPSGSGKSTVARAVAVRLGLRYLDTGAMYRAWTWWLLSQRGGVPPAREVESIGLPRIDVGTSPERPWIRVAGVDVAEQIRLPEVTAAVSAVSAVPWVRTRLVEQQREVIGRGGIVVEGRDIGTTVAPSATVKVFLVASAQVRAARRARELARADVERVRHDLSRRDAQDSTRAASPLVRARDAQEVDTTARSVDDVVDLICGFVDEAMSLDMSAHHAAQSSSSPAP